MSAVWRKKGLCGSLMLLFVRFAFDLCLCGNAHMHISVCMFMGGGSVHGHACTFMERLGIIPLGILLRSLLLVYHVTSNESIGPFSKMWGIY